MPQYAYMNIKAGSPIDANDVEVFTQKPKFYCCTKNCNAEMVLCKHGTGAAYFKSKRKSDHLNNKCIKYSIKNIIMGNTGTQTGTVGGSKNCRIHTLLILYAMCLSKGKTGSYNGILIDNILADDDNYNRYKNGITGYKIVETSKYYENKSELSFMMNYPADNREVGKGSWVKIKFDSKALFEKHVDKLKNSSHIEPVIIAGNWEIAPNGSKHHSECIIHKASQLYYAKVR